MANTSRMKWPVPPEQGFWYEAFVSLLEAIDQSAYAGREDRNLVLMGGGTFSWNAGTNTLTWGSAIQILSAVAGSLCVLPSGSITLLDGQVAYILLVRNPVGNPTVSIEVGNSAPSNDSATVVCVRRGSQIYFRNGNVLKDGMSGPLVENGGTVASFTSLYTSTPEAVSAAVGSVGNSTSAAPGNHKHRVTTAAPVTTGAANSEGGGDALARAAHVHRVEVPYKLDGAAVGARPSLNFSTAFSVADNPGGDRVDVGLSETGVEPGNYTNVNVTVGADGRITSIANGGAGAVPRDLIQSTSPPGGAVWFALELYIGPGNTYSYSSGGGGYLPGMVFSSTLKRITFRTAAMDVDVTVRLRTAAGVSIYSKVLLAGETLIDEAISIAVGPGVLVQLSVEPSSGSPTMDAWHFGWVREIT